MIHRGWHCSAIAGVWIAGALFGLGLVPLALLSWKFGQANAQSVAGIDDSLVARTTIEAWLWYARGLPAQLGWPTVALAGIGLVGAAAMPRWRLPARDAWFLMLWFGTGYLVFSAIDLKDLRFTIFILFPVVVLAVMPLDRLARGMIGAIAAPAVGVALLALTLVEHPVPWIAGLPGRGRRHRRARAQGQHDPVLGLSRRQLHFRSAGARRPA